jgi:hypothetical protein
MIIVEPSAEDRKQARSEAKKMGVLRGSISRGRGNEIGMLGEIVVQREVGGSRVGDLNYSYDITLPNGLTIDVKTTKASGVPQPHYAARIYGAESSKEKLCTKCNVYYFVRCNQQMTLAVIVGWLPARQFIERAIFLPKGSVDPNDGKLSFADEFVLPISELNPPSVKITKKRVHDVLA